MSSTSVVIMLEEMGIDSKSIDKINKNIKNHSISTKLTILRAKENLTQKEFSKKSRLSMKFIEKVETSSNDEISYNDIKKYTEALGYKFYASFKKLHTRGKV